jgi:quercetin dioxygenase-like cupin family protein/hemerythrin-like domain-containing protein
MTTASHPHRPLEPDAGTLEFFALRELAEELRGQEGYSRTGVAGHTLVRSDDLTLVLVALRAGAAMREHRAPAPATLVLLSGRARFVAEEGPERRELVPGSLVVFAADVPHAVEAREDTTFVLVIGGRERPHPREVGDSSSVMQLLGGDHRRLDTLLADAKLSLSSGDLARARERFAAFRRGLERHIEAEEEVLFPALEAAGSGAARPIAVMRAEHAEIRRLMADVAACLERAGGERFVMPLAALTARIYAHNGKEERVLYPTADRMPAVSGVREALARRLRPQ